MSNVHDIKDSDMVCIGFPAELCTTEHGVSFFRRFEVSSEFFYWWREFSRCAVDRWVLFDTVDACTRFQEVSTKYDVEPDRCIIVPKSLRHRWATAYHAVIIEDFSNDDDRLSHLAAHFSEPDSY